MVTIQKVSFGSSDLASTVSQKQTYNKGDDTAVPAGGLRVDYGYQKPKSMFSSWKFWTAAVVVAAAALGTLRATSLKNIQLVNKGFSETKGLWQKTKYASAKIGEAINKPVKAVIGWFSRKGAEVAEAVPKAVVETAEAAAKTVVTTTEAAAKAV